MTYTLNDLTNAGNDGLTKLQKAEKVYIYILQKEKATQTNPMSSTRIWESYVEISKNRKGFIEIVENSCPTNLSTLASSTSSSIKCDGTRHGYYLETNVDIDTNNKARKAKEVSYKEVDTYPLLKRWLLLKCNRVKDIHSKKSMTQWGNPDVLGINSFNYFGNRIIEVTTIEAKVSLKDWRKLIFEAVSHSMFVNKSYFAFIVKEEDTIPEDLLLYAQKYGLGLIAITIPITKWGMKLTYENCMFRELLPPIDAHPSLKLQREFLQSMKILESDDLLKFGEGSDDFK